MTQLAFWEMRADHASEWPRVADFGKGEFATMMEHAEFLCGKGFTVTITPRHYEDGDYAVYRIVRSDSGVCFTNSCDPGDVLSRIHNWRKYGHRADLLYIGNGDPQ